MAFPCIRCSKNFRVKTRWIYHLKREHGLAPLQLDLTETGLLEVIELGPNVFTPSMSPAEITSPAFRQCTNSDIRFKVAFDLSQGGEVRPIRTTVPRNESYDKFLGRLQHIFGGDSFERSLRQWEYVLVNWRYEKGDPLPLTSPSTYYAMVGELLRPGSRWRHAVVRRSVSVMH